MNPAQLWMRAGEFYTDRTAVIVDDREQTYGELVGRGAQLANAFTGAGLVPGDRVAILADNAFESLEQWAACALGNFVRSSLYAFLTPEVNATLMAQIGASALIVQAKYYDAIAPHLDALEGLRCVVVFGGPVVTDDRAREYESFLGSGGTELPQPVIDPEDPHIIRFTGGTTGLPRAVLHSVRGWSEVGVESALTLPRVDDDDAFLAPGPLTHAAGVFVWPYLSAGAKVIIMSSFDAGEAIALIERHQIRNTQVVPTMAQAILSHPDAKAADFSSLRAIVYGGAPMPEPILRAAIARWGNILYQMYGQSEAIGGVTVLTPKYHRPDGDELERSWLRAAGRPTPRGSLKIVGDDGNELPRGEIGEVAVSTPSLLKEMYGDAQATAARMRPDGYWLTRDLGYLSPEGFLFLVDRKDDMIISGGYNIWPFELENVLLEHPAVAEAAVVGMPHPKWIETPYAAVVLRPGAETSEQELIEWVKTRLGSVKKPSVVAFVDEIPKSGVGKVIRRGVRDYFEHAHTAAAAADEVSKES